MKKTKSIRNFSSKMEYVIDSYAWVEYFIGSKKGEVLKSLFSKSNNKFYTIEPCLAEIKGWSLKNGQEFNILLKVIKSNSEILEMSENDWINSGKERFEQRKKQKDFGLIDSTILVKQKEKKCKVVSGDKHFRNIKEFIFMNN